MSGEFGSCGGGYFYDQVCSMAEDCLGGNDKLTKLWGKFLEEFKDVAHAIAWSEAGDSGEDDTILCTMRKLPELKKQLMHIEKYIDLFTRVAKKAIANEISYPIANRIGKH